MTQPQPKRVHVIDSHTGGEPTRVIVAGGPALEGETAAEKRSHFRSEFDDFRRAVITEPRGSDVIVGALLTEPADPSCKTGMIFFNNAGCLGMCGHATIGVISTLAYLGKLEPGEHRLETPVGVVTARLHSSGAVSFQNVPSFRYRAGVIVRLEGGEPVRGDVAWGGNWFFLTECSPEELLLRNVHALSDRAWRIRQALERSGIAGKAGQVIDHIELSAPSATPGVHSRNFVLCPGRAYDRSPCGTGTSAKIACLAADGLLAEGEVWRQESITGSVFEASFVRHGHQILPTICGTAYITAESTLVLDPDDPYCWGIPG